MSAELEKATTLQDIGWLKVRSCLWVELKIDFSDPVGYLEGTQKAAKNEFVKTLNTSREDLFV